MSGVPTGQLHKLRLIYRRIIKNHNNWSIDEPHYDLMKQYTRTQFEAIQKTPNYSDRSVMLAQQEKWINECTHPDPYVPGQQVGGPVFQRNVPPPYEILEPGRHLNPQVHGGADHKH